MHIEAELADIHTQRLTQLQQPYRRHRGTGNVD